MAAQKLDVKPQADFMLSFYCENSRSVCLLLWKAQASKGILKRKFLFFCKFVQNILKYFETEQSSNIKEKWRKDNGLYLFNGTRLS